MKTVGQQQGLESAFGNRLELGKAAHASAQCPVIKFRLPVRAVVDRRRNTMAFRKTTRLMIGPAPGFLGILLTFKPGLCQGQAAINVGLDEGAGHILVKRRLKHNRRYGGIA